MRFGHPIPILRSFDEAKARVFYVGYLGFTVDWEHRFEPGFPLYMQLSRDDMVLHVTEHYGDATPGSALRVEVGDVDALLAELRSRSFANARPDARDQPWGTRDMTIQDPFGNRLTFYSHRVA